MLQNLRVGNIIFVVTNDDTKNVNKKNKNQLT